MYKLLRNFCSLCVLSSLLFAGCERYSPSPVEIKVDEDVEYSSMEDYSTNSETQNTSISAATHKISGDETLFDVAYRYNVDPMNLAKINNITAPYKVKNGQVLQLPDNNPVNTDSHIDIKETIGDYDTVDNSATLNQQNDSGDKKKDKLDEEFKSIVLDSKSSKKDNKRDTASDEAALLSVPKIVESAPSKTKMGTTNEGKTPDNTVASPKKTEVQKSSKFIMPTNGKIIAKFGDTKDGALSEGFNIKAAKGTPVKAANDGVVIYVGNGLEEDYGNIVVIQHSDDVVTSYAHLDNIFVKKDEVVRAGHQLGTVGKTGDVTEPQLYFEVMKNKVPVDPSKYLNL